MVQKSNPSYIMGNLAMSTGEPDFFVHQQCEDDAQAEAPTNNRPTSHLNADRLGAGRCLGVRVPFFGARGCNDLTHIIHVWYCY